ncbi:hypothetical protein WDW37_19530 [Bdellovibrionota bacterium FG-1]
MDNSQICNLISQVTKGWTPLRVELLEPAGSSFTLRIVSDHFIGVPMLKRFDEVTGLLHTQLPELVKAHLFDLETWTAAEFTDLEKQGKTSTALSPSGHGSMAAHGPATNDAGL